MWNFLNSRFFSAVAISIGLPIVLYVLAMAASGFVAKSITTGVAESVASLAKGENQETIKDIVSGFTKQVVAGFTAPFSEMKTEQLKKTAEEINVLDALTVKDIKLVDSEFSGKKIIGTIINGSTQNIKQIRISVSGYNNAGTLVNVSSEWLSDLKIVKAKESANFSVTPGMFRLIKDSTNETPSTVKVQVSNFEILTGDDKHPKSAP